MFRLMAIKQPRLFSIFHGTLQLFLMVYRELIWFYLIFLITQLAILFVCVCLVFNNCQFAHIHSNNNERRSMIFIVEYVIVNVQ